MSLNNVPVTGQSLGASRDLINQNFAVINTAFSVNHVQYNDGSGTQGLHQYLQLPTATPIIATAAAQVGVYSKNGAYSAVPELYFQRESLAADSGYAFTESQGASNGWTVLPSGIILKWGQSAVFTGVSSGANPVVTYPVAAGIPVFNNVFQVMLSQRWTTNQTAIGSTGFAIFSSSAVDFAVSWNGTNAAGTVLTYLAIGN